MFNELLIVLLLFCITIQLGYALYFFAQIFTVFNRKPQVITHKPQIKPVSVIICAKNEAANLEANLPLILSQRYANEAGNAIYEVIVVNDASTDNTATVLARFELSHANLRVLTIATDEKRTLPGKKFALNKAIAVAKYDFILMTDADCLPAGNAWLLQMVQPLYAGKSIVAGYGKYRATKGLLNAFIRWETLHTFVQYTGYAMAGKPYMAVGRNLACTKEALLKAQQTKEWGMLPSGDDDLLVRSQARAANMAIVANTSSFTISDAKASWNDWMKQKQRHTSTGKYYKTGVKLLLALYAFGHAVGWLSFFVLLFTNYYSLAVMVMLCRCLVLWVIWYYAAGNVGEKNIVKWFPVMDIAWMLYNFALSPYIFLKNKQQWT